MKVKVTIISILLFLIATAMQAQITIGGNVYGGGNAGKTGGNSNVTIREGNLNRVYGGARMADVGGRAFMNIDGANASDYIIINRLYGGNDISGSIGTSTETPSELPDEIKVHAANNGVDKTWNALVLISSKMNPAVNYTEEEIEAAQEGDDAYQKTTNDIKTPATLAEGNKSIYIGQLFGGGDGEYVYGSRTEGTSTVYFAEEDGVEVATSSTRLTVPNLGKTFLDIHGGSIVYAYGGGNNATVTERTVISLDNPSNVVNSIKDLRITTVGEGELLTNDRFENQMGINTTFSYPSSDEFQIGRMFGGNNKADMAIRPRWNLQRGSVRNLYGGGNEGRMTTEEGLLLQIEGAGMVVDNVYGGCRRADVKPLYNNNDATPVPYDLIQLDPNDNPNNIPAGYAARVRVLAGHVNNVYGGNDITGNVYGGNTVGIMTHIYGDVYGGGNGSYAYTDNAKLKDDPNWSDFYYNPTEVLEAAGVTDVADNLRSVTALNLIRPNAEKVSILVRGTESNPTIIDGSLYVGGNSASLREQISGSSSGVDQTHIKIGSHVVIDKVFLGNNGENMVKTDGTTVFSRDEGVLRTLARTDIAGAGGNKFNSMVLTDKDVFAKYMEGCAMKVKSTVVFESILKNGDKVDYIPYTTQFGSFYCGGNVGSMITEGKTTINFSDKVIIYDKMVGGCNNANVYAAAGFNAEYLGGLLGNPDPVPVGSPVGAIGDKLELNLSGLKIEPKRWMILRDANYDPILDTNGKEQYILDGKGNRQLEWNTVKYNSTTKKFDPVRNVEETDDYKVRRLLGGNIYGGCYNNGIVNGNVIININETLVERDKLFDVASNEGDILYENPIPETGTEEGKYNITKRNTGVILSEQGMDVLGDALNVFGGGYGGDSDIWGSTTINLNRGYVFQIFGGGEMGAIGNATIYNEETGKLEYEYNPAYSTYINLNGDPEIPGAARGSTGDKPGMAECEFIYGGGFEGVIAGDTHINLGNGRIFNSFAGSCNADILGHTETYVGRKKKADGTYEDGGGFPWIRDHIYGGNDLGGSILGHADFSGRIRDAVSGMVDPVYVAQVQQAATYMEYTQGRVRNILGGCFGDYDYTKAEFEVGTGKPVANKPYQHNAFVNFRPNTNADNAVEKIFGAGEGCPGDRDGDKGQDHSYVLIDVPNNYDNFANTEVFGAGAYNGLGMSKTAAQTFANNFDLNEVSAIIDLMRGRIGAAYGGSYEEGVTRRTVVNVPLASTIKIGSIFGGAYGSDPYKPCDVYEANVNYLTKDDNAYLIYNPKDPKNPDPKELNKGAIFGGNNLARRTLYGKINIFSRVRQQNIPEDIMTTATVYGAGCGSLTWNEYTEVNLNSGANVWEVYGGGQSGGVMSAESVQTYINLNPDRIPNFTAAWSLGSGYDPDWSKIEDKPVYAENPYTNLTNKALVRDPIEIDDKTAAQLAGTKLYNTNVIIKEGAYVGNYAYGGGLGNDKDVFKGSGDVYGTTYIALLGGTVAKDIYAAGTSGSVYNLFGADFTASANAYIAGGSARNIYGGGWKGSVGSHMNLVAGKYKEAGIDESADFEIPAETHVVIGKYGVNNFTDGSPAIGRNVYGGGEGGAVYGITNVTVNNGYIGYVHLLANQKQDEQGRIVDATGLVERYEEKIIDETYKDPNTGAFIPNRNLNDAGNVFGGGYVDNSSVDRTNVKIYGGYIRSNAFGGGEIAAVGRGTISETTHGEDIVRTLSGLYYPGKTHIEMYGGHVYRNVFGGGRGYDNLGRYGKLHADGCVFGQTEVHIHGGEIGSAARLDYGDGNVFGGGDIGMVFSALEEIDKTTSKPVFYKGVKIGERYKDDHDGYYYKHTWADSGEGSGFIMDGAENIMTEDCKVLIEPHCMSDAELSFSGIKYTQGQEIPDIDLEYLKANSITGIDANGIVTSPGGISFSRSYPAGSYVPTAALNTLKPKTTDDNDPWKHLDPYGIVIHNAVFAGGNTPSGKSATNANIASVFGNATASINDVYHRDLISLGTNHQGGLYGDGNLTLVDGYRELNITNYGTDYYSIKEEITIDEYKALPDREADYYELKFTCIEDCIDKEGTNYKKSTTTVGGQTTKASTITYDELMTLFLTEKKDNQGNTIYVEGTQTPVMESIKCTYNSTPVDVLKKVNNEWMPNTYKEGDKDKPYFWEESGVLPVYAGRPMNTIQRADFCGVWGSRMVMQGARDRVPDEVDLTNYTINRVREVSLNKKESVIPSDTQANTKEHGNYFGIYNIVNYLGALTSDVDFGGESGTNQYGAIRVTDNENTDLYGSDLDPASTTVSISSSLTGDEITEVLTKAAAITGVTVDTEDETITASTVEALYKLRSIEGLQFSDTRLTDQTYYDWKKLHHEERKRNNGNSHNKVALASGVYLEITSEESTGYGLYEKVWGPITGVIELDLINVQTGIGGGFVYAKNVHGVRSKTNYKNTTLTALNKGAVTHMDYDYKDPDQYPTASDQMEWETSGNFVHSTQTIIDDCYNVSNKYVGSDKVPAHYWYIKGSVYVYDQYISAYTGSPNAFSEAVDIPLTITAASHGSMKLLDVKPNRYAYYSQPGVKLTDDKKISIGDKTFNLNDPISYWDWYLLSASERALFIENTYVNCVAVNIDGELENGEPKVYEPGTYVMTESEFTSFGNHTYKNAEGETILDADKNTADKNYIFRPSNDIGHNTGYILTYQVNNPSAWDTWYSPKTESSLTGKITKKVYNDTENPVNKDDYEDGPTYRLDKSKLGGATSTVLGQSNYKVGDLISKNIEDAYPYKTPATKPTDQANFEKAYIIIDDVTITEGTDKRHLNPGATISATQMSSNSLTNSQCDEAYICTKTIQLSKTDLIYRDTKMSEKQMNDDYIDPLYTEIKKVLNLSDERIKQIRTVDDLNDTDLSGLTDDEKNAKKTALKPLLALKNEYTDYIVPAYYCTKDGLYGGSTYTVDQNYRGLEAWSSMSEADRKKFIFNYDALDLLIDPLYGKNAEGTVIYPEGKKYEYDGNYTTSSQVMNETTGNKAKYSLDRALDYTATYKGANDATSYNNITLINNKEYTSEQYEKLPNEQRHYVAIHVKDGSEIKNEGGTVTGYKVYVVNKSFQIGNTPYAVGATINSETYASLTDQSNITVLTFPKSEMEKTYYYCRESYNVGYNGNGIAVTNVPSSVVTGTQGYNADGETVPIKTDAYINTQQVPIGLVIDATKYGELEANNKQKNFTFHGISPTETSTLYVSRESDIYNLSKDKIITVIYQYDYEESDSHGNVTPVSERHVLNIHIKFESGVPVVEDITKPDIILPGDFITIGEPNVLPGAYEVTGGGWELFETPRDAESHVNGVDYNPTFDPLYWYQHDWYVAYYAKSYLGRTYSNAVPVSVANYHDLANVMSDANKEHHMYIDNPNVKREPKIYINDYTPDGKNGLDELKKLFDLSLVERTYNAKGEPVAISGGTLNGHVPMDSHVKGGADLEFFLRTDIDHSSTWTSIASGSDPCFEGTLHGDGHTISGLNNSLFNHLCGAVYNLGVTGSFTGAGIAEKGSGYVENCWISNDQTVAKTSKPIFGSPERTPKQKEKYGSIQIVNSYYQEEDNTPDANKYTNHTGSYGVATRKDAQAFYNGEVAYDLNGFYLNKRFYDKNRPSTKAYPYNYMTTENGTLSDVITSYYPASPDAKYGDIGYVEDRYADGDFIYARGEIPTDVNERFYMPASETGTETVGYYYPIWPDDYLFFGQRLNYGYEITGQPHQALPSVIQKSKEKDRVITSEAGNRVYRAPAYFRNSKMKVAHFNPYAFFAAESKDGAHTAYPNMTAIDFTGYNDANYSYQLGWNQWSESSQKLQSNGKSAAAYAFYPPLLDDGGLTSFTNADLTQNLLAYTPDASVNEMTYTTVTDYLSDLKYEEITGDNYRRVAAQTFNSVKGHAVVKSGSDFVAQNDHFLVDKNDFNAPMSYKFVDGTDGTRMWYQRTPDRDQFVDRSKGWDAISLPFSAELVTTHQKGEITHFYDGSAKSQNGTLIGHEYWLRLYCGIGDAVDGYMKATMNYPNPTVAGGYPESIMTATSGRGDTMNKTDEKAVANRFLWDYYYSREYVVPGEAGQDANTDIYRLYYRDARSYSDYKMLTRGTPYIIGFPGATYYEFDLSGEFDPQHIRTPFTASEILRNQTITFASPTGTTIRVSDDEKAGVTYGGYTFYPSYLNETLSDEKYYTLLPSIAIGGKDCSAFKKISASTDQIAFRPFFKFGAGGAFEARGATRDDESVAQYIIFDDDDSEIKKEEPIQEEEKLEGLIVNGGRKVVVVKSNLRDEKEINIVNMAGVTLAAFTIQPGETITTNVALTGVYIVRTTDGRYTKKVLVR